MKESSNKSAQSNIIFHDRHAAGKQLAAELKPYLAENPVVVALPRGGLPVAFEVAAFLQAPLTVAFVHKVAAAANPEAALGAVTADGIFLVNQSVLSRLGYTRADLEPIKRQELRELDRRLKDYQPYLPSVSLHNETVLIVDDGLATGLTMEAAISWVRKKNPKQVVAAFPVGSLRPTAHLRELADDVVALSTPANFTAVSQFYQNFNQVDDQQVIDLLKQANAKP